MIEEDELLELFKAAPKESFELLLRNINIRKTLEELYKEHSAGLELKYDERFRSIFREFFRFFFRPLEIAVQGVRQLRFLLLDLEFFETQRDLISAYYDFFEALIDHLRLTWELGLKKTRGILEDFVELYSKRLERYRREFMEIETSEYFFLYPKEVFDSFEKAVEKWEGFANAFREYRELMENCYADAARRFIEIVNNRKTESYNEFANLFYSEEATAFDKLLVSQKYLRIQKEMLDNLMDYIYYFRRFIGKMVEGNPVNPFATLDQLDVAFKRIMDLKRKIKKLERRIEVLERKCGGVEGAGGEN